LIRSDKYNFKIHRIFPNLLDLCAFCDSGSSFKKRLNASGRYIIHSCTTPLNAKIFYNLIKLIKKIVSNLITEIEAY